MIRSQQQNQYLLNSIQTATPAQLLVMLYDGAIRFCKLGIEGIKQANIEQANENLGKAQAIINEFIITLDDSSDISPGLAQLYEYMNHQLVQANVKKDVKPAEETLAYLIELKETWLQAAKSMRSGGEKVTHG